MKKAILWSVVGAVAAVFTTISNIDSAPELTDLQKANLAALSDGPGGPSIIEGGENDGVVVRCSSTPGSSGLCWKRRDSCCEVTGVTSDSCTGEKCK